MDEEEEEDEVEEDDEEEEEDEENGDEDEEKEDKAVKTLDRRLWYQGIEYECQICFHMMFDGNSIVKHIQKRHKMTMKLYVHQFKSLSSKECVYECQICHESVKHSKAPIAR